MFSKDSRVKVTDITYNLIFGVTDTGLPVTSRIIDLMENPEIYNANPDIPGIAYRVPVYDSNAVKHIKYVYAIPFTRQSKSKNNKSYYIVNKNENTVLSWTFQFEKSNTDAIQFLTEEYAKKHIEVVYNSDTNLEVVEGL